MIEEIKRHVTFLRTGDRLLGGVAAKFSTFHRWTLEQLKAETVWKPSTEFRKRVDADGNLVDTQELLPPTVDRTLRHMALERLLVLLATIPRLEPSKRRSRANEITEACDYLEITANKPNAASGPVNLPEAKPDKPKRNRIPSKYRSKPITKRRAAGLLGRKGNQSSVTEWLSRCIADGTIQAEEQNRQSFVFDIRDFPDSAHRYLRPEN
jgi:hypothetical protein